MINRVLAAIENFETVMIDLEVGESICLHMEFVPEEIEKTNDTVIIYGTNGDIFQFRINETFINSEEFYYIESKNFGKAIVTFA